MNKEYLFLKNLYSLLNAGYSIEETLLICEDIFHEDFIHQMILQLKDGIAIENILLESHFSHMFKEYFRFYKNKNCLSEAIKKSLDICLSRKKYHNRIQSQLTYPLILLVFLFFFSIFVVFILLPNVEQLFESFQIQKTLLLQMIFLFFYLVPFLIIVIGTSISILFSRLFYALRQKSFRIIEWYLHLPFFKQGLQKYFSLKFAIYYQELLNEEIDSARIIHVLNEQLNDEDLKIVLYEMNNRMNEGEALEEVLSDFEYLDPLFLKFFQMYIKNPMQNNSLLQYIQLTHEQIDLWISQFLKYLIPAIYTFVAIFVITIYISIIIPMMNIVSTV